MSVGKVCLICVQIFRATHLFISFKKEDQENHPMVIKTSLTVLCVLHMSGQFKMLVPNSFFHCCRVATIRDLFYNNWLLSTGEFQTHALKLSKRKGVRGGQAVQRTIYGSFNFCG